jgi:hypothetical protein
LKAEGWEPPTRLRYRDDEEVAMYLSPEDRVWVYALVVGVVWGLIVWRSSKDADEGWKSGAFCTVGLMMYGAILVGAVA